MQDFERFSSEGAVWEHDGHPGEVSANIKSDREVGYVCDHRKYFFIVHSFILSGRHPFPKGGYTT